jgi:hypothetical protein
MMLRNRGIYFQISTILVIMYSLALGKSDKLGNITLTIADYGTKEYSVKQALLYKKVSITYDSTILVQDTNSSSLLYIPQLRAGESNILRIVLGDYAAPGKEFYDFYFDLGDSIPDSLTWKNERKKIYMTHNGKSFSFKPASGKITGKIDFIKENEQEINSGTINLDFSMHPSDLPTISKFFTLKGSFMITTGEYREITLEETIMREKRTKQRSQTASFVIIASVIIFVYMILK